MLIFDQLHVAVFVCFLFCIFNLFYFIFFRQFVECNIKKDCRSLMRDNSDNLNYYVHRDTRIPNVV